MFYPSLSLAFRRRRVSSRICWLHRTDDLVSEGLAPSLFIRREPCRSPFAVLHRAFPIHSN